MNPAFRHPIRTLRALYDPQFLDSTLQGLLPGEPVAQQILTGTAVDTGWWFFRPRIRLVLTAQRLLLFATGKIPLIENRSLADGWHASYNPFTGEWLLPEHPDLPARRLRLSPAQTRNIRKFIKQTLN